MERLLFSMRFISKHYWIQHNKTTSDLCPSTNQTMWRIGRRMYVIITRCIKDTMYCILPPTQAGEHHVALSQVVFSVSFICFLFYYRDNSCSSLFFRYSTSFLVRFPPVGLFTPTWIVPPASHCPPLTSVFILCSLPSVTLCTLSLTALDFLNIEANSNSYILKKNPQLFQQFFLLLVSYVTLPLPIEFVLFPVLFASLLKRFVNPVTVWELCIRVLSPELLVDSQ